MLRALAHPPYRRLFLPFIGEVWHVYVLIFLLQSASATFTPTFQSVIPQVLEDEQDYTAALSLSRLAYDLESVLSPALAGLAAVAALWVVIGWSWASVETPVGRVIRGSVAPSDLPAAFAAQFSLSHACWLLTYPLAGWLGSANLSLAAIVLAGVAGAATLAALALWPSTEPAPRRVT